MSMIGLGMKIMSLLVLGLTGLGGAGHHFLVGWLWGAILQVSERQKKTKQFL